MKFAVEDDFLEISELFKNNRKLFPHIRMGYLLRSIQQNECIYTDGVVIIFKIHQRTVRIGNITIILHPLILVQISSTIFPTPL